MAIFITAGWYFRPRRSFRYLSRLNFIRVVIVPTLFISNVGSPYPDSPFGRILRLYMPLACWIFLPRIGITKACPIGVLVIALEYISCPIGVYFFNYSFGRAFATFVLPGVDCRFLNRPFPYDSLIANKSFWTGPSEILPSFVTT